MAREKLKMFDPFLTKITKQLAENSNQYINPDNLFYHYWDLDLDEQEFIDYLLFQVQNNVSNVRNTIDPISKLKYPPVFGKYETSEKD